MSLNPLFEESPVRTKAHPLNRWFGAVVSTLSSRKVQFGLYLLMNLVNGFLSVSTLSSRKVQFGQLGPMDTAAKVTAVSTLSSRKVQFGLCAAFLILACVTQVSQPSLRGKSSSDNRSSVLGGISCLTVSTLSSRKVQFGHECPNLVISMAGTVSTLSSRKVQFGLHPRL